MHPAAPDPGFQKAQEEARNRQRLLLAVFGTLAVVAAILVGLGASGILKFGAAQPEQKVLARPGPPPPPPVLAKTADTPPPVLQKPGERVVMPDEVYQWLKHLEETERRKNELTIRQIADMAAFLPLLQTLGAGIAEFNPYDHVGDPARPPESVTHGKFRDLKPDWEALIQFFDSMPPPPECQPLADDYRRALAEIPGMTSDLADVLNNVQSDPSGALERVMRMKGGSHGQIDRFFTQADVRLGEICQKYDTRKWFNIRADVGGSLMGRLGG